MPSWRDAILNRFVPDTRMWTLVADPDGLLTEERLLLELRARGFEMIEYDDPIEFRFMYEAKYRSRRDHDQHIDLVIVLRSPDVSLDTLPYDIQKSGRPLQLSLGDLFPNLSYPVVASLDRELLDVVYMAQRHVSEPMGDNASMDFILRHVYGIAAELIHRDVDLLHALLRLHYGQRIPPPMVRTRLIHVLRGQAHLSSWPVADLVCDTAKFYAFLNERWPLFVHGYLAMQSGAAEVAESAASVDAALEHPGPVLLPFDHQDIRVYMDNLFVEGLLTPIQAGRITGNVDAWMRCGLILTKDDDAALRIDRLFHRIEEDLPGPDARHTDWLRFAQRWAELSRLVYCSANSDAYARLLSVGASVNTMFHAWLAAHYASLVSLPPTSPVMLHHIPRRLVHEVESAAGERIALIVVDGLSLDQWIAIRQMLRHSRINLLMRESAVFAWVPTLTSISRRALFAGRPPSLCVASQQAPPDEERLWKQFWENHGIPRRDIAYQRGLGDGCAGDLFGPGVIPGKPRVLGLVIDTVDRIMHGMQLGAAGMHNQIDQWCGRGYLVALLEMLLDSGYSIWLTSDHGNIECTGAGRPAEGVLAETRGQRARVYPNAALRGRTAALYADAIPWDPIGLPDGQFPLLAGGRSAFIGEGESAVCHGGVSIEEVIVPLVRIERGMNR